MPVFRPHDKVTYELHGACFDSYVAPSRGSEQLCAWRTDIAPGTDGTAHTVSDEEVFLVLDGTPCITIDDQYTQLGRDDVVLIPAGATLRIDNPGQVPARFWVTTRSGITASTPAGETIQPPWTT